VARHVLADAQVTCLVEAWMMAAFKRDDLHAIAGDIGNHAPRAAGIGGGAHDRHRTVGTWLVIRVPFGNAFVAWKMNRDKAAAVTALARFAIQVSEHRGEVLRVGSAVYSAH
jgi:hypothetical protein